MTDGRFIEVELEPAFACNRHCDFCARWDLNKPDGYMSMEVMLAAAESIARYPHLRVCFAGRGEPFLHSQFLEYVAILRAHAQECYISVVSNGDFVDRVVATRFFEAGGNILGLDCYGRGTLEKRQKLFEHFNILHGESDGNPWERRDHTYHGIVLMQDTRITEDKTRTLWNQGGALNEEARAKYGMQKITEPLPKKCVMPFRRPSIWWNGDISICCRSYDEKGVFSNILFERLDQAERSVKLVAARQAVYNKRRDLIPACRKCDFMGGYRQGLIQKMAPVSEKDEKKIKELWGG